LIAHSLSIEEGVVYGDINHDLIALNMSFVYLIGRYFMADFFALVVGDRAKT
jgi:hypothetical protein